MFNNETLECFNVVNSHRKISEGCYHLHNAQRPQRLKSNKSQYVVKIKHLNTFYVINKTESTTSLMMLLDYPSKLKQQQQFNDPRYKYFWRDSRYNNIMYNFQKLLLYNASSLTSRLLIISTTCILALFYYGIYNLLTY